MKSNILAISPAGATLSFFDIEKMDYVSRSGVGLYRIFQNKKDKEPIAFIPVSWALNRKPAAPPVPESKDAFKPFIVGPIDRTGPSC